MIKCAVKRAISIVIRMNAVIKEDILAQKIGFPIRYAQDAPENRQFFPVGSLRKAAQFYILISVFSGIAAQLIAIKGPFALGECWCK